MEKVFTAEQIKRADEHTINDLRIAQTVLIERVGNAVANGIKKIFDDGKVLVCIGKGNNGEDGKVIAKNLSESGFSVSRFFVAEGDFTPFDGEYDFIVDALLGTGLNREINGVYKTAVEKINGSGAFVVSVDIPSGLDANNGQILGACVKADLTFAVQELKTGYFLGDGVDYCGDVRVIKVGIESKENDFVLRLDKEDAAEFFPKRKRNVHKGNFGKAAVVGGSKEYSGSVILSFNALTALKSGLGYANLTIPESLFGAYAGIVPECTLGFLKDENGRIVYDEEGLKRLFIYDALCIGMGAGVSEEVYRSVKFLLENYEGKLLIDADGLNSLAKYGAVALRNKKCTAVITPHVKEFSRLSGLTVKEILSDPIGCAKDFSKEFGVIVVLKNATSVITDGERVFLNTTGTNALSKGGSGDTLSGFISGLLVRRGDDLKKVAVANYVYGLAAEIATKCESEYTVTATDVIKCLPKAINSLFDRD